MNLSILQQKIKKKLKPEITKELELEFENIILNTNDTDKQTELNKLIDKNKFYLPKEYDNLIHKYLELKITTNDILFFINDINNNNMKNQLIIIDNIININNLIHKNLLEKEYNKNSLFHCELDFINCDNNFNNEENDYNKLLNIKNILKIEGIRTKKYYTIYNDEYLFNTYQCYFKSALYFFINNGDYINKIIQIKNKNNLNKLTNSQRLKSFEEKNIIDSDIINTDQLIYGGNFTNIIIDNINKQSLNNIIPEVRDYLNDKYNNKYLLCIPGVKIYPSIVINDILKLENNYFSEKCFFKLDNKVNNLCGYIYDLTNNSSYISINSIMTNFLLNINYKYINNILNDKDYFKKDIINYLDQIKDIPNNKQILFTEFIEDKFIILPDNLLIHCPMYDSHELFMCNNIFNIFKHSKVNIYYSTIKQVFNIINNYYNINIIYPYYIKIQDINYYLHSFIICNSNEKFDSHFVYYKIDYKQNNVIRIDGDKKRIINYNEKNKYYQELKILDIKNNRIIDNMFTKVVFVCYRKNKI